MGRPAERKRAGRQGRARPQARRPGQGAGGACREILAGAVSSKWAFSLLHRLAGPLGNWMPECAAPGFGPAAGVRPVPRAGVATDGRVFRVSLRYRRPSWPIEACGCSGGAQPEQRYRPEVLRQYGNGRLFGKIAFGPRRSLTSYGDGGR